MATTKTALKIVAICVICTATMMSGCVENEPIYIEEVSIPMPAPTHTPESTPMITPTLEEPVELILNVGESAKNSKTEVSVDAFMERCFYSYNIGNNLYHKETDPGYTYIIILATVRNIGNEREYCGSSDFILVDSEGYRYDPIYYVGDNPMPSMKELYMNQKVSGCILFEIPDHVTKFQIQYNFGNIFTNVQLASWNINTKIETNDVDWINYPLRIQYTIEDNYRHTTYLKYNIYNESVMSFSMASTRSGGSYLVSNINITTNKYVNYIECISENNKLIIYNGGKAIRFYSGGRMYGTWYEN